MNARGLAAAVVVVAVGVASAAYAQLTFSPNPVELACTGGGAGTMFGVQVTGGPRNVTSIVPQGPGTCPGYGVSGITSPISNFGSGFASVATETTTPPSCTYAISSTGPGGADPRTDLLVINAPSCSPPAVPGLAFPTGTTATGALGESANLRVQVQNLGGQPLRFSLTLDRLAWSTAACAEPQTCEVIGGQNREVLLTFEPISAADAGPVTLRVRRDAGASLDWTTALLTGAIGSGPGPDARPTEPGVGPDAGSGTASYYSCAAGAGDVSLLALLAWVGVLRRRRK